MFPPRSFVFSQEKTYLEKCSGAFKNAVVEHENATDEPTPYALIADPQSINAKKHLLVVVADYDYFLGVMQTEEQIIKTNGCEYPVIGFYHAEETTFLRETKDLKAFFSSTGDHVDVSWHNRIKVQAEKAAQNAKEAKKAAKKHRRQQTASTTTSSSGTNMYGALHEEDEDAETRSKVKKEKEKAKKKAYQARRKAKQDDAALIKAPTREENGGEVSNVLDDLRIINLSIFSSRDFTDPHQSKHGSTKRTMEELSDSDKDDLLGDEDSSSDDSCDRMKVVKVDDVESGKKAVRRAKGPVLIAAQEDLFGVAPTDDKQGGHQYFGPRR